MKLNEYEKYENLTGQEILNKIAEELIERGAIKKKRDSRPIINGKRRRPSRKQRRA